jgi:hypothetical protein
LKTLASRFPTLTVTAGDYRLPLAETNPVLKRADLQLMSRQLWQNAQGSPLHSDRALWLDATALELLDQVLGRTAQGGVGLRRPARAQTPLTNAA